jgi:hypothetical protein
MGEASDFRETEVLDAVRAWERVCGDSRRALMIYRDTDGSGLVVDVLELIDVQTRRDQSGRLCGVLVVCSPQVEKDDRGKKHVSWSNQHRIQFENIVFKKMLPAGWPGFDSFMVNSWDPIHSDMQRKYEAEVQRGLKLAAEKGFK